MLQQIVLNIQIPKDISEFIRTNKRVLSVSDNENVWKYYFTRIHVHFLYITRSKPLYPDCLATVKGNTIKVDQCYSPYERMFNYLTPNKSVFAELKTEFAECIIITTSVDYIGSNVYFYISPTTYLKRTYTYRFIPISNPYGIIAHKEVIEERDTLFDSKSSVCLGNFACQTIQGSGPNQILIEINKIRNLVYHRLKFDLYPIANFIFWIMTERGTFKPDEIQIITLNQFKKLLKTSTPNTQQVVSRELSL